MNFMKDFDLKIQTRANFIWIRHKDFKLIRTTEVYKMCYPNKKVDEIDWSDERGMYYTKHARWSLFKKRHTFIGEIYDKKNKYF